jgi:hypothetical protein
LNAVAFASCRLCFYAQPLLHTHGERPACCRSADELNELASSHVALEGGRGSGRRPNRAKPELSALPRHVCLTLRSRHLSGELRTARCSIHPLPDCFQFKAFLRSFSLLRALISSSMIRTMFFSGKATSVLALRSSNRVADRFRPTSRRGGWSVVAPSASFRTSLKCWEASYALTCTIRLVRARAHCNHRGIYH